MRKLISTLSSLKLTVVLVVLIAVVLSAGTIVESLKGTAAAKVVYEAAWFYGLQGLFALNIAAALFTRWPKNRWRLGFALTHASMLLILGGAVMTLVAKREGQLPLWEGEQSSAVRGFEGPSSGFQLPFAVRLDDFQMEVYPGTRRPAAFRSRVTVVDPQHPTGQPALIEMNRPLSYGGFRLFQSSYEMEQGREGSVLSVARDPGQPIVFLGYALLVAGMIVVFATRLAQARRAAALEGAVVLAVLALLAAPGLEAAQVPDAAVVEALRAMPVQHDGRTMPFDTMAREAVQAVTGKSGWNGHDPVAVAAGWMFDPQGWQMEPMVRLGGGVAEAIGLPAGTRRAAFGAIVSAPKMHEALEAAHAREAENAKGLPRVDKDVLKLEDRLGTLYGFLRGNAVHPIPSADAKGTWQVAQGIRSPEELAALADRIRASGLPSVERSRSLAGAPEHYPSAADMLREIRYNALRPSRISWVLMLLAAVAAGLTVGSDRFGLRPFAGLFLVAGFAAMTWGIALRWQIAGRIPAANMYESMLFLGWGVGLFGLVALLLKQRLLVANATGMGALAMMLADLLPIDAFIHPIAPVLAGTPWLAIHVPIVVVSYSVFAMATGLAHMVIGVELFAPSRRHLAARWGQLLYWYLHVGSILLIAGILTGSVWAASSWGRYWGWDPKEVWSLVAFLAYMAILHARFDEQLRGFGVAVASIGAFWTILMTYLGVNFVLASGLHSYGFGSSSLVRIFGVIALVEIAFLAAGVLAHRRHEAARSVPEQRTSAAA